MPWGFAVIHKVRQSTCEWSTLIGAGAFFLSRDIFRSTGLRRAEFIQRTQMNKSHRSIWNESLCAWVAGSEITKGRGKKSARQVTLAGAALGAALSLGVVSQAMAADECGVEVVGPDEITCAASNYAGGTAFPAFPTGIIYTGSDGLALTLDDPTITITALPVMGSLRENGAVNVISSTGLGADISIIASDFDTISADSAFEIENPAIVINLLSGYLGGASIILGEQAGTIATTGRSPGAIIRSFTSGPGDLLLEMHGGDIITNGFQANAIQINQNPSNTNPVTSNTQGASDSTGTTTIRMTGGTILAQGWNSDGITINSRGLGAALVEMTGGSIAVNNTSQDQGGGQGIVISQLNPNSSAAATVRMTGGSVAANGLGALGISLGNSSKGTSTVTVGGDAIVTASGAGSLGIGVVGQQEGGFNLVVDGTASVIGGAGSLAAIAIASGAGGSSGTISIGAGATIDGGVSGVAILDAEAFGPSSGSTTTMTIRGTLRGNIQAGARNDAVNIEDGANITAVGLIDGGADMDRLTFSNWSGSNAAARSDVTIADIDDGKIANMEEVFLTNNADVTFGGTVLANGSGNGLLFEVQKGSIARFSGNFTINGNVNNFGTLDLSTSNSAPGKVLTVTGNYAAASTLILSANTATMTGDRLVINGSVISGSTTVRAKSTTPNVPLSSDLVAVTVVGTSMERDFVGALTSGAFDYSLVKAGNNFVFSAASKAVNSTGAVYEAAPSVLDAFNRPPTLEQRVGQRQEAGQKLARADAQQPTGGWIRVTGDKLDATTTTDSSIASKTWGMQAGADFALEPRDEGQWVLGVTGQYGKLSSTVTSALGLGTIKAEGFGVGATATWYGNTGTYVDLQGQANWIDSDIASSAAGALVKGHGTQAYALSAEVGRRFALSETTALVPQAQLTWGHMGGGAFTDSAGNTVDLGSNDRLIGRIGLAYEYAPNKAAGGNQTKAYVIGNILHDFSGNSSVQVAGASLSTRAAEKAWGEIGVGGNYAIDANKTLYGEALYRASLGGSSNNNGLAATVGLRVQW